MKNIMKFSRWTDLLNSGVFVLDKREELWHIIAQRKAIPSI
jgi:hypothetical protein